MVWNNLKKPTMSKKRPEGTYIEQETIWNNLQRARNELKGPTTSKKLHETTYNKPETAWNKLEWARNDRLSTYFKNWFQTFLVWYFFRVLPLTAYLRIGKVVSMQKIHESWFSSTFSHTSCNLANFFSIFFSIFIATWEPLLCK